VLFQYLALGIGHPNSLLIRGRVGLEYDYDKNGPILTVQRLQKSLLEPHPAIHRKRPTQDTELPPENRVTRRRQMDGKLPPGFEVGHFPTATHHTTQEEHDAANLLSLTVPQHGDLNYVKWRRAEDKSLWLLRENKVWVINLASKE